MATRTVRTQSFADLTLTELMELACWLDLAIDSEFMAPVIIRKFNLSVSAQEVCAVYHRVLEAHVLKTVSAPDLKSFVYAKVVQGFDDVELNLAVQAAFPTSKWHTSPKKHQANYRSSIRLEIPMGLALQQRGKDSFIRALMYWLTCGDCQDLGVSNCTLTGWNRFSGCHELNQLIKAGVNPQAAYDQVSRKYDPNQLRDAFPHLTEVELAAPIRLANEVMTQINAEYRVYTSRRGFSC